MNNQNIENVRTITKEEKHQMQEQIIINYLSKLSNPFATLSVQDVSKDLHIGINQAYELFKQEDFPTINIGKRKTVTLAAYLLWKMSKKAFLWRRKNKV